MNAARTALLFGSVAGTTLAAMMLSAGTPAHAQATCVAGFNSNACIVPSGTTVSGNVTTNGDGFAITNNGTMENDVVTLQTNSGVTNTGTIGQRLQTTGDGSPIINSGTVGTFINAAGDGSPVTNSGTVGTFIDGTIVTNSGSVGNGVAGDGIILSGTDSYLTLLPGSVIQGTIEYNGGGTRTLNVGNGLSINNTLDFTGTPVEVVANGAVFAAGDDGAGPGTRVAVVDPTNLSTQDEQLVDLTGGIASVRENRLAGVRNGAGGAVTTNGGFDSAAQSDPGQPFWIEGFGSYREQEADQPAVETDQWIGGVVIGADDLLQDNLRLGFLGGAAWGGVEADFNSQETDSRSFFVGTYASLLQAGLIFDLALTGGYSEFDQDRSVANNTVAGGLETATADFSGWFVSPELTVTKPTVLLGHRLEGSLALRYAGLFLDGYTESGTTAPLTVDDRDVHIGVARLQIAAPSETVYGNGSAFRYRLKAGLEARTNFGGETIDGALLGQNISFNPGGDENTLGGYVGLSGEYDTGGGLVLTAGAEGLIDTSGSFQVSGRAGVAFRF